MITQKPPSHFARLESMNREAMQAGGAERLAKLKAAGKNSARERLQYLCDPGSFQEIDRLTRHDCIDFDMQNKRPLTDGVITGAATIGSRPVFIFSQDATIFGGSLSYRHAQKIVKIMDLALNTGVPIIGLNDSGGARIQEGVRSLGGYAEIFLRNTLASGVIPQISVILGPCAGGAVYSPAITDFTFMTANQSYMFVTGPEVLATVTHENITKEELGGALVHNQKSGVAHFLGQDESHTLDLVKELLKFLPGNNRELPPLASTSDSAQRLIPQLDQLIPENPNKPYDMKTLIQHTVDNGSFFEVQAEFAQNIFTGFAHLGGMAVGIVANQPMVLAGCLDINASTKAARFVRFCDCFNIPLITFVDVPGFLPGKTQEHYGIIRHGAKLLFAFAEATVPKITLITRKAYGGAYDVMSSKHIRGDINLAYPNAEIAVMGPEGAVNIVFREELSKHAQQRETLIENYREKFANPYIAAELGYIDEIIIPQTTRTQLCFWLKRLQNKRSTNPPKKHSNIPL